jgi:hypothetical protein
MACWRRGGLLPGREPEYVDSDEFNALLEVL